MNKPSGFGDAEAKRILERAAEIDAERPVDAGALREIALEAGISPASLDQALEEHLQPPVVVKARPTFATWLWQRRVLIISIVVLVAYFFFRRIVP
jgi:hypothetical protein